MRRHNHYPGELEVEVEVVVEFQVEVQLDDDYGHTMKDIETR